MQTVFFICGELAASSQLGSIINRPIVAGATNTFVINSLIHRVSYLFPPNRQNTVFPKP